MKRLGRIAAAFMASVFFLTGIPAMTAFAADEIPAAEEVVTETPTVEPVPETPAPETPAPETPVVTTPENGGGTPETPVVTDGAQDVTTDDAIIDGTTNNGIEDDKKEEGKGEPAANNVAGVNLLAAGDDTDADSDQPLAEVFAYSESALNFIKADGSGMGMYAPQEGTTAVLSGNKVKITYVPKQTTTYVGFYLDADITAKETWTADKYIQPGEGGSYSFELDKSYCGKAWPVAIVKSDQTTTKDQFYLAIPAEYKLEGTGDTPSDTPPEAPKTIDKLLVYNDAACTDDYGMFVIQNATVTENANGTISLTFTTSSKHTTFDKIYFGKATAAPSDNSKIFVSTGMNSAGERMFSINGLPKNYQNSIQLVQFGKPDGTWNETQRYLAIPKAQNSSLTDEELEENQNSSAANAANTESQTTKPASDTNGSTAAVDNSTSLADGMYTPDKFSFSGGSGRVTFTCTQVRVTDGKAYATLEFNSSNFQYVKASGGIYYCSHSGDTSSVEIPIALNQNNTIIGLTTAMSQPHEITYTIFVYIAGADAQKGGALSSNEELDKEAPVIPGLKFESEEKLEYAENFKIFNYSEGIRLLEIDMRLRDDKDDAKKDDGKSSTQIDETTKKNAALHDDEEPLVDTQEVPAEESEDDGITTTADAQAELYKGNVIKYLLVPENVEIPAGLEKEVIVINLPVESVYSGSDEIREVFKESTVSNHNTWFRSMNNNFSLLSSSFNFNFSDTSIS